MQIKGILIPIGGNEDKGNEKTENYTIDFIERGILSHVVKEAGSIEAPIVIIPTASRIPEQVGLKYMDAFGKLGCKHIEVLDIRKREDANHPENMRKVNEAAIIMFSGGDQSRITRIIGTSSMKEILLRRYQCEPVVIAGTSAGAMAMSEEMIAGGKSADAMFKGSVKMRKGLGLLPNLIIDSHFIQRGRFNRLPEALAKHTQHLGVGLAEDTGLVIKNGNDCKVIGSGMVIVFDPSQLKNNNERYLAIGTPMSMTHLIVHILTNGDHLQLRERHVTILPVDESFDQFL